MAILASPVVELLVSQKSCPFRKKTKIGWENAVLRLSQKIYQMSVCYSSEMKCEPTVDKREKEERKQTL